MELKSGWWFISYIEKIIHRSDVTINQWNIITKDHPFKWLADKKEYYDKERDKGRAVREFAINSYQEISETEYKWFGKNFDE